MRKKARHQIVGIGYVSQLKVIQNHTQLLLRANDKQNTNYTGFNTSRKIHKYKKIKVPNNNEPTQRYHIAHIQYRYSFMFRIKECYPNHLEPKPLGKSSMLLWTCKETYFASFAVLQSRQDFIHEFLFLYIWILSMYVAYAQ